MGAEPPFIYDPPSRYSFTGPTERGFNPKAASQASLIPPRPRPKQEGPLIDTRQLNRHPDSYFIVPYGNLEWKPMSPRTKSKVQNTRRVQLLLRLCALLGALGMLFCVICIKNTTSTVGWVIRIPAAVAILHTIYAVYHLARSSTARTPATSASYMLFAAIIDAGLIPFFAFTALMARTQYTGTGGSQNSWQTLFGSNSTTYKIVLSTFVLSVVDGSFHLLSLFVSIYLTVIFRKISKLPPDMNPLEENLTSRHKRNKSSVSQASTGPINSDPQSQDPLISPPRTIPFFQTRTESTTSLSNLQSRPPSTVASQVDLPSQLYQHTYSQRSSRANLNHSPAPSSRTNRATQYIDSRPPSTRPPSTRPQSTRPPSTRPSSSVPEVPTRGIRNAPSLLSDNWFVYASPSPSPPLTQPAEFRHLRSTPRLWLEDDEEENLMPNPLEMHPPTPPHEHNMRRQQRTLLPVADNWNSQARPDLVGRDSFGSVGLGGKERFYGDMTGLGKGSSRVVSSGADVMGGDRSGIRAREVSGKVAEEGRVDDGWVGSERQTGVAI
ncbi:MAG: hypothetical protein FRX48_07749 [Lasallia pustulata]|uniref:Uncharacterized protein n=1 Tax=Lasallia pustulata TaxID=136370 RepID=A0A5M8PGZ5_9LECA|nr:MAG: hypothetical protein FRX48_07749 [Lasallia pustulata]